jgi:DNA-binding NarL/FixJ family response regulator
MVQADLKLAESTGVPSRIGVAHRLAGLALGGAEGLEHLQQAVHVLDGAPTALERARALVDVGAALRRGRQRVASREVLRTGWELAQRCGAFGLANRAREELVITGARPRQEIRLGVNALTPSELRVAGMADEGKSNKEIAQALFITMRTVETHLTHVFQKLDISSRRQLPEALQRLE